MKKFNDIIFKIANKIYSQLSGFEEKYYQSALGIEFRKKKLTLCEKQDLNCFMRITLLDCMN